MTIYAPHILHQRMYPLTTDSFKNRKFFQKTASWKRCKKLFSDIIKESI